MSCSLSSDGTSACARASHYGNQNAAEAVRLRLNEVEGGIQRSVSSVRGDDRAVSVSDRGFLRTCRERDGAVFPVKSWTAAENGVHQGLQGPQFHPTNRQVIRTVSLSLWADILVPIVMGIKNVLLGLVGVVLLLHLSSAGLVKKVLRHRRETLAPRSQENLTMPHPDQPVVFNHVYNINVPATSLCSVDLDSPGGTEVKHKRASDIQSTEQLEQTLDGDNQIVFTHRINIPKQACGCDNHLPDIKDILNRLEMLESELSSLREQCNSGTACCGAPVIGEVSTKPYCNGRGNWSSETCGCVCDPGWKGPNCSESECPNDCQDQGRCLDGKCACFEGFDGDDCSLEVCMPDCGDYGHCTDGSCLCEEGFIGEDCSQTNCLNNCLGRGRCVEDECVCDEPWTGFDCSELICPNDCYDRGRCDNGTCYCDEGFTGEDCGELTCPGNCNNRGMCVNGQCVCHIGYSGDDCSKLTCPDNCSERGHCFNGKCICDPGFEGESCDVLSCPDNCNHRGKCVNGECVCDVGYEGEDCGELSCPNDCLDRGRCVNGQCVCNHGFAGEDCSVKTCPKDCMGRGECIDGKCCVCDEGFVGEDCGEKTCPNNCLERGYCVDGNCVCFEGFSGLDCSLLTCPGDCQNQGRCENGVCACDEGFIGEDCSEVSPPKDLTVVGVNPETVDLSWVNEVVVTEYLVTYVPTAIGGLEMDMRVPGDQKVATIKELEPGVEYLISVYAILKNKKSIPVSARISTHLPEPEGLKFKSVRETSVEVQWDPLDIPFDGWNLIFRNTKEENGEILNALGQPETTFEQSGLGPGQEYEVKLEVVKNKKRGPPASKSVVTRIDAPGQVSVRDVTDTTALVTWFEPIAQVESVRVSYGPSADPADRQVVELPFSETQHHLGGLSPDTQYQTLDVTDESITLGWSNSAAPVDNYRIKPGTEYGMGVTAVKEERESLPTTTNAVTALDAPKDLRVVGVTETTMSLEWRRPTAKMDAYRLVHVSADGHKVEATVPGSVEAQTLRDLTPGMLYTVMDAESGAEWHNHTAGGEARSLSLTGLSPATWYRASVYGVFRGAPLEPVHTDTITEAEPEVHSLWVSEVGPDRFSLSWEADEDSFDSFVAMVRGVARSGPRERVLDGPERSAVFADLAEDTEYEIELFGLVAGRRSKSVTAVTITELGTPNGIRFSDVTDTSATVHWMVPRARVDSYRVTYVPAHGAASVMERVSGNIVEFQMDSLSPATHYTVKVYAMRDSAKSATTSTDFTTDVDAPQDLAASNILTESGHLTWRPPRAEITGYILSFHATDGAVREVVLSPTATSYNMAQLTASTEYTVRLQAIAGPKRSSIISTVFVRRQSGKLEFFRNWKNYTAGFGDMNDEFWLGLSNLHKMTAGGQYELRVDLRDKGESVYAQYDRFSVSEPHS
ncbi:hypothetical protein CRUP_013571 [Coryphaenoides rupestris]|nr:hypothetical protein CRUP_013571 [Coryphaenoides rupestris]